MPRIFASLAIATLTLFALTAVVAFTDQASAPDRHVLLAVGTLLIGCLIQVVGFTYLTVTGKVIAQAVHLATLDPTHLRNAKQHKKFFTRHLVFAIVSVIFASASGGAAWRSRDAGAFHIAAAMIAAITHIWVYWRQHQILRRNADLVESTLKAYSSWRTQRISHAILLAAEDKSDALVP